MMLKQRLATASPVVSRLSPFGTRKNPIVKSTRHAFGRRRWPSCEEDDELDMTLENTAVSAPFFVTGSQRLREPLKLFLTGAKAAARPTIGQESSVVNIANYIEIGADGLREEALQALLQAAEPAPFGLNSESVLDPTYRDALQIKAGSFGLSAVLPTPQMLHDISTLMQPAAPQIFAQLHKVNVYGPGGMFKAHADTPTCAAQFGSLVVALPYEFEGGELVVTHAGQSATLTLGGGGGNGRGITGGSSRKEGIKAATAPVVRKRGRPRRRPAQVVGLAAEAGEDGSSSGSSSSGGGGPLLHFAAFFSDCIHEVLPVRSGHRVTLTFNLLLAEGEAEAVEAARKRKQQAEQQQWYCRQQWQRQETGGGSTVPPPQPPPPLLSTVQPLTLAGASIPFVAKLRQMLAQPTWHPFGCTLGYVMQHEYATSLRDLDIGMFPRALKGGDRLLHAALCGELGLEGKVRPLHFARAGVHEMSDYDGSPIAPDNLDYVFVGHDFQRDSKRISNFYLDDMTSREQMENARFTKAKDAAAVWIGLRKRAHELFTLRTGCIAYGNDPTTTTVYSAVVLLLEVPAWGTPERARAMAAVP